MKACRCLQHSLNVQKGFMSHTSQTLSFQNSSSGKKLAISTEGKTVQSRDGKVGRWRWFWFIKNRDSNNQARLDSSSLSILSSRSPYQNLSVRSRFDRRPNATRVVLLAIVTLGPVWQHHHRHEQTHGMRKWLENWQRCWEIVPGVGRALDPDWGDQEREHIGMISQQGDQVMLSRFTGWPAVRVPTWSAAHTNTWIS